MAIAYIALGANLGDAAAALKQALTTINDLPLTRVCKASSLYKTAPLDSDATNSVSPEKVLGGDYLNAVVEVQTGLSM